MKTVFSAGGLWPRARVARASPAAGSQGELRPRARAPEQRLHPLPPVGGGLRPRIRAALVPLAPGWQGGSGRAPQRHERPRPKDSFFESTYPEMQRKHIPRVNEYQS